MPCVWVYIGCRVWFYLKENKSEFAIIFKESTILLFNVYINLSHSKILHLNCGTNPYRGICSVH